MSESFKQRLAEHEARKSQGAGFNRLLIIGAVVVVLIAVAWWLWTQSQANRPVNPNTATREQLMNVVQIGPEIADRIIANRPYVDAADMEKRVKGIGPKTLEKMKPRLDFNGDGSADCCVP